MTREEIIAQFQGSSDVEPTVYIFSGSKEDLKSVANTTIRMLLSNGVLYFVSSNDQYTPTDPRMEIL